MMRLAALMLAALHAACGSTPRRPVVPKCQSAAPPDAAAELARWQELGRAREELYRAVVQAFDTHPVCADAGVELAALFAARAQTLADLRAIADRTGGRFLRWADAQVPAAAATEPTMSVSDLECSRGLDPAVGDNVAFLTITPTCSVVE
jgi:hypothetical protein